MKKIWNIGWKVVLGIFFLLILFIFWMSPRLGGLIAMGKDQVDTTIYPLRFDYDKSANIKLAYRDLSQEADYVYLRETYKLDSIVQHCHTEFEQIAAIQSWVQSRWVHDGENVPEYQDAVYILREAEKGRRFRCVEYATVAQQCLASLGFRTRQLSLMIRDIAEVKWGGGHVVNEVYMTDLQKWVFIDPQYDAIIIHKGVPMNAIELQACLVNGDDFELLNPNSLISKEDYKSWIAPYLYYFTVSLQKGPTTVWDRIVGNKRQLTLYPIDAEQPAYFQKMIRLNTAIYTHAIQEFYPRVKQ
ncbi:transglutaminase-like domain-containing protein [Sphingobacterium sp. lm-10]|uniref:transglutaminase-like domain-containing protein n=1 Tax=Sphingobacterium sp. lm-10 TaxID=2944904 RepID=UPI00201FC945|nr:transglutaminase-like domain-containing protein [Sphingobacterium sp. lm-10]MCL7987186.1 transglutaminase-like domain-containing protein [Sphingobacterium sp. lm-10]